MRVPRHLTPAPLQHAHTCLGLLQTVDHLAVAGQPLLTDLAGLCSGQNGAAGFLLVDAVAKLAIAQQGPELAKTDFDLLAV